VTVTDLKSYCEVWLNHDPIQEWGGYNLYNFLFNSPINGIDWLGLCDHIWDTSDNKQANQQADQQNLQMRDQLYALQLQLLANTFKVAPLALPVGDVVGGWSAAALGRESWLSEAIGAGADEGYGQLHSKATGIDGPPIPGIPANPFQAAEQAYDWAKFANDQSEYLGTGGGSGNGQNPLSIQYCSTCNVNTPSIYAPPSNSCNY